METRIASQIFQKHGLDIKTAKRAGGWTNEVWLNEDVVLRLSLTKNSDRIRREIQLSQTLPAIVGYPVNISSGVVEDYEWSISKRINGMNLSAAWPGLCWADRARAIRKIWAMMQAVHDVDLNQVIAISAKRPWYSSLDSDEIISRFRNYVDQGIFSPEQGAALTDMLKAFFGRLATAPAVLNHGDITADNLLWNEGEVVTLLDFEHAVTAPAELDLNSFINLAFFDEEGRALCDDAVEFQQYQSEIKKLIDPLVSQPDRIDLLFGFTILFQQRFLEFWLENPSGQIEQLGPYNKLVSLTDKRGSYLSKIIGVT